MPKYAIRATPREMAKFGLAVRARRQELKLGLRQLSRLSGISYGMLCHIEKGENYPSLQAYIALCRALDCPKPPLT
jgi:transcriptional regulator with XRE-family HTH domain